MSKILETVILDKTPPRISIGSRDSRVSHQMVIESLDRIDVFYGTNEGLKESKLEFFLRAGGKQNPIWGSLLTLITGEGSHRLCLGWW